ncbi:DUF2817 domain-containing protein [Pacificispira sp.]|uniref:DUF2817 domain-containing protein n=1 Tax=Pacificispira sp. TaxID=2888761 RepID=UPI003B51AFDD
MSQEANCFSDDVERARERFLIACDRIGLRVTSYRSRLTQRNGHPMYCDVTRLGSPEAKRAVVLCSAAAGPAGLLGCGGALGVITAGGIQDIPKEVGLILVHAANPGGPVWPYFADGDSPAADGPAPAWSDGVLAAAEKRFSDFQQESGFDWTKLAGQTLASMSPPAWDGDVLREIAADRLKGLNQICVVDPRTGPGQFGAYETVSCDPKGSAARDRADSWFAIDPAAEDRVQGAGNTPCAGGLGGLVKTARVTNVIVEIGTYSMAGVLSGGDRKDAMRSFPSSADWRVSAWRAMRETLRRAYQGLMREG